MVKYTAEENSKIKLEDIDPTYYQNYLILQEKELTEEIDGIKLYSYYEEHYVAKNYFKFKKKKT